MITSVLSQDRAYELSLLGVEVLAEDLCMAPLIETLLVSRNLTHVVHLAAQAGVRYSLDNPLTYVRSNVQCQLVLLDALSRHPVRQCLRVNITFRNQENVNQVPAWGN